jgi:H+/Cl- antiporter ClcA
VRIAFRGSGTDFAIGTIAQAHGEALEFYTLVDPRIAALVGMTAVFAGASRALLTAVVFTDTRCATLRIRWCAQG